MNQVVKFVFISFYTLFSEHNRKLGRPAGKNPDWKQPEDTAEQILLPIHGTLPLHAKPLILPALVF